MTRAWIGIDIAKLKFDVALFVEGKKTIHKVFDNTLQGFIAFEQWVKSFNLQNTHFCLEATGIYSQSLSLFLHEYGYAISVVNPARIKAYAASEGVRGKTDKIDAGVIARFCKAQSPHIWTPPSSHRYELQSLYRCWQSLQEDLTRLTNRQESSSVKGKAVQNIWQAYRQDIEKRLQEVAEKIQQLVNNNDDLKKKLELLESIPGIGNKTAIAILSELPDIKNFEDARDIAAFAGLTPKQKESGTSVRGRRSLCKMGNATLRKSLYFPAIVAKRYNPLLKEFSEKLEKKGKKSMVIIGAVMRKLLHIIYGVLKHHELFTITKKL